MPGTPSAAKWPPPIIATSFVDHWSCFPESTNKPELPIPDSGSSQFLISMLSQPIFDGQMTVFGRVIEGLPVLGTFQRIDLTDEKERKDKSKKPDMIVEAKVLRKRNHPYIPEIVNGRLP